MDSSPPRTCTDLSLDQLKIMFGDRISARRLACVESKYDLLKYLWKECQLDDCYLEKYTINNRDEISRYDDVFSKYLLESTDASFTGQNEYATEWKFEFHQFVNQANLNNLLFPARQRLADRIQPMLRSTEQSSLERFEENKFKIHNLIRSEIADWWQFGRHLNIKQGKLDSINKEQNEVARKVDEVFKEFETECCNEVTYINKISNALINARRKDLSKKVYDIMER